MSGLVIATCGAVLAGWWIVSALHQVDSGRYTRRIRRHIPLGLLPGWTFFAPNPARADHRLIWREYQEPDGRWQAWRELHFGFARPIRRWLWNPELVLNKSVSDLVNNLRVDGDVEDSRAILVSASYVVLLSVIVQQVRDPRTTRVQFAVTSTAWDGPNRRVDVLFVSEEHDLAAAGVPSPGRVHAS